MLLSVHLELISTAVNCKLYTALLIFSYEVIVTEEVRAQEVVMLIL